MTAPETIFGTMQDEVSIGARIKQVRADSGLTQDAFGKPLGVTRGAVANWERGLGIKRDNLLAIAERFKVSFDWLLATGNYNSKTLHKRRLPRS